MIPYTRHDVTPEDETAVLRALRSGYLTQGPEVEAFEAELAALTGAKYAVAVNSGTAALYLMFDTAKLGTDLATVPMPAISFVATANAALHAGWEPSFVDCSPLDGLPRGGTAVCVTLGGKPFGASLVDAAHGPLQFDERIRAACFSFHPAKHVAAGEGGAVVTDDKSFADRCRLLRSHGRRGTETIAVGFNFRMPEMSAALARSQLTRYHAGVEKRRTLAARYDAAFAGTAVQPVQHGEGSARHLYQVLLDNRDMIAVRLAEKGVGTAIHYPVIPLQPYYRERYGYRPGQFPGAEAYAARTLSIPLFPSMTWGEQEHVITSLLEVCG